MCRSVSSSAWKPSCSRRAGAEHVRARLLFPGRLISTEVRAVAAHLHAPGMASVPKRFADRALAFNASVSLFRGSACVTRLAISFRAVAATSATASSKAASLDLDGTEKPLSFRTNWSEASRISSSVAGGSKLKSVLMLRHMTWKADVDRCSLAGLQRSVSPSVRSCGFAGGFRSPRARSALRPARPAPAEPARHSRCRAARGGSGFPPRTQPDLGAAQRP